MACRSLCCWLVHSLLPLFVLGLAHVGRPAASLAPRGVARAVTVHLRRAPRRVARGLAVVQQPSVASRRAVAHLSEHEHVYQGTVHLGSESRPVTVVFDTGSANLVVPAGSCTARGCSGTLHRFDPAKTSSGGYVMESGQRTDYDGAWRLSLGYASGKVAGEAFEDRVCLGTACAMRARFLLAEYESDDFAHFSFDGILGLAPRGHLAAGRGFSLVDELVKEGVLPERMFAIFLSQADGNSEVTLGGYDPIRAGGGLIWLEADLRSGAWELPLEDFRIAGRPQRLCADGPCKVVLDSGCSAIGLPGGLAGQLAGLVNFTGDELQCSDVASSLPPLGFVLGGRSFELAPEDYVEVSSGEAGGCRLRWSDMGGARDDSVILGHPFLLRFYSVFDEERRRIGLAPVPRPAGAAAGGTGAGGGGGGEGPAGAAMRKLLMQARAAR